MHYLKSGATASKLAAVHAVADSKSILTPMVGHADLKINSDPPQAAIPFGQLAGLLLWLAAYTPGGDAAYCLPSVVLHPLLS